MRMFFVGHQSAAEETEICEYLPEGHTTKSSHFLLLAQKYDIPDSSQLRPVIHRFEFFS
jgi:hypothetical protein